MDEESSLNDHPFFQHLLKSNVISQACAKGYIIAIPPARSLPPNTPFSRDFSLSHILLPSKRNQGSQKIFHTLLSRTLILRDDPKSSSTRLSTVSTRTTSWPERRDVSILGEEQYYTESFESFTIFHISLPLLGPINGPYLALVNAQTLSRTEPVQRAFQDHVSVLLAVLGEDALPAITQQTQSFLNQLKTSYQLIRNFETNLNDKIDSFCASLLIGLLSTLRPQQSTSPADAPVTNIATITKASDGFPLTKKNWAEVCVAIEYLTMTKLSSYITRRLAEIYHEENNILYNAALWAQKFITDEDDDSIRLPQDPSSHSSHIQPDPYRSSHSLLAPSPRNAQAQTLSQPIFSRALSQSTPTPTPPLIFLPHPTTANPLPYQTPPQTIVAEGHSGPRVDPNHKFFQLIGLRPDLACADFTVPALALQKLLSTVQFMDENVPPTELYQAGLLLQGGLLHVNQLIQQALIQHYTQPPASNDETNLPNQDPRLSDLFSSPSQDGNITKGLLPSPQPNSGGAPTAPTTAPLTPGELTPEIASICAVSAEDQIPLFLYLLVLAPTYSTHSQCLYLCTFSPVSTMLAEGEGTGMGYGNNPVGLPTSPAELCLPTSKVESICISLRAAVSQLYQQYSQQCPNQVYLLQQSHGDRPPAHNNVIRVAPQSLGAPRSIASGPSSLSIDGSGFQRTQFGSSGTMPMGSFQSSFGSPGGGSLDIFSGSSTRNMSPPVHPLSPSSGLTGGLGGRRDGRQVVSVIVTNSPLDELDQDQVRRLQAEQDRIQASKNKKVTKKEVKGDEDEDDFLTSLME